MTERTTTVPASFDPQDRIAQLGRWLEGYVDDKGERHPGLIEMVGELYGELKIRRERREAIARGLTIGGTITLVGAAFAWLKEHIK